MISLYAIAVAAVILGTLCLIWQLLPIPEPYKQIGWYVIGAVAILWLLKVLFFAGPGLLGLA